MFGSIRNIFGNIKITQSDKTITVDGVPADVIERDISKIWNTSKICSNMFTKISKYSFSFPLFFAPDIVYTLNTMINHRKTNSDIRTLTKIRNKLMEETWLIDTTLDNPGRLDFSKLSDFIYEPLPHQTEFLKYYDKVLDQYDLNGMLLAAAPGAGKTFCGLIMAHCSHADKVIIISPKNAINRVWENSIQSLFKHKEHYWIAANNLPYKGERFIVGHYEALEKVKDLVPNLGHGKIAVILDECHNLNEVTSVRTQAFIELCKMTKSKDIILMSGTPIKALGSESIPLFRIIDPYFTEDTEQRFRKIYGKDASKGLDILKNRLGLVSFKVEKSELKLQPPIMENVSVKMPNSHLYTLATISTDMKKYTEERRAYFKTRSKEDNEYFNRILDNFEKSCSNKIEINKYRNCLRAVIKAYQIGALDSVKEELMFCNQYENKVIIPTLTSEDKVKFKEVKTIVKYVDLKIQGECLGRVLGRKRIQCHVDMIPFVDFKGICNSTAKKTVVFTSFVEALEESKRYLETNGFNPLVVYGKTNHELADTVKQFEASEDLNPLIATYNSLSTAVPLVMADTMIMLNAPFRAYIQEQAISRIHRLGADTQTYVYMVGLDTGKEPNISTRSIDILAWSQEQVNSIMGIQSPYAVEESTSLESMQLTISTEQYDITETVDLKEVLNESVNPQWMKW